MKIRNGDRVLDSVTKDELILFRISVDFSKDPLEINFVFKYEKERGRIRMLSEGALRRRLANGLLIPR